MIRQIIAKAFFIILTVTALTLPSQAKSNKTALVPLADYAKFPAATQVQFSPKNTGMAFMMALEGRKNLIYKNIESGKAIAIPPVKKANIGWYVFLNDHTLLISYNFTTNEFGLKYTSTRLFAFDLKEKEYTFIQPARVSGVYDSNRAGNIQDKLLDLLPDEENYFLMGYDMNDNGNYAIMKVNAKSGKGKFYQKEINGIQNWKLDQQNQARYGTGYYKSIRKATYLNPVTNKWEDVTESKWYQADMAPISFFEDPRFAYMIAPDDTGLNGVVKYDMVEDKIVETLFRDKKYDVNGLSIKDGKVLGYHYTHDHADTHYIDPYYKKLKDALEKAFGSGWVSLYSVDKKAKRVIFHYQSLTNSGSYYIMSLKDMKADVLSYDYSTLVELAMSPTRKITYQARDGLEIDGYLTIPQGKEAKNLPTIIMPHGGPSGRDDMSYDGLTQMLANRGYAVFRPNFRGSTGYGDFFKALGKNQWGGTMQDDVTDGTKKLIKDGISDPKKICIMGWSYGGYAALMGAVKEPTLYACSISINGVVDLPYQIRADKKFIGGRSWVKDVGLEGEKDKDVSPYHQRDRIQIPTLLIHAKDDTRVPYEPTKRLYKNLKKRVKASYVEFKFGGHSLMDEAARLKMMNAVEDFLRQHLPTDRLK